MPEENRPRNGPIGIHIIGQVTDVKISENKFIGDMTGVLMEERDGIAPSDIRLSKNEFLNHPEQKAEAAEGKSWFREYWIQLSVAATVALGGLVWGLFFGP
ncbi:hypothetical protein D3X12_24305 [Pseudomonas protegens]|jgi:hypothetical protein|uniref:Uncharacterized protein n=1 Tax=Pseudomonas protegens TaxID=380021 RepID=A0ABY2VNV5_9PSED|nr:hypothetical protein [Pseudomonas protegens]ASE22760.1 hypothetical protein CEP86_20630 [Pseudomonas protegens]QEZ53553.1 hypothetical protein D3X12_24305 [Pseudomonas protegens]QEZ60240.1 hypothetical protein D4N38_27510 [Pseudomonas protegens]QEZ64844.1 hypothetical protein D4N37_19635 [Pseudomonas protegens]QIC31274.1 hypothetical protein FQ342_23465 [Pseudomonas protegens]